MTEGEKAVGMVVGNLMFVASAVWASHYWFHETVVAVLACISLHVARGATNLKTAVKL